MNSLDTNIDAIRSWLHSTDHNGTPFIKYSQLRKELDQQSLEAIQQDWRVFRRDDQPLYTDIINSPYFGTAMLCGRAFGKSRFISETCRDMLKYCQNMTIGIVAPTHSDIKKTNFGGKSGLYSCLTQQERDSYEVLKNERVTNKETNVTILFYSAQKPERLRGPSFDILFLDELVAWNNIDLVMEQIYAVLREGLDPKFVAVTSPMAIPALIQMANDDDIQLINKPSAANYFLTPKYVENLKKKLSDRMFRQECLAELLTNNPDGLFQPQHVVRAYADHALISKFTKTFVTLDPCGQGKDQAGVITFGEWYDSNGNKKLGVIDSHQLNTNSPSQYVAYAMKQYHNWGCSEFVLENNGVGQAIPDLIETYCELEGIQKPNIKQVVAKRSQYLRAENCEKAFETQSVVFLTTAFNTSDDEESPTEHKELIDQLLIFDAESYRDGSLGHFDMMSAWVYGVIHTFDGYSFTGFDTSMAYIPPDLRSTAQKSSDYQQQIRDANANDAALDPKHEHTIATVNQQAANDSDIDPESIFGALLA